MSAWNPVSAIHWKNGAIGATGPGTVGGLVTGWRSASDMIAAACGLVSSSEASSTRCPANSPGRSMARTEPCPVGGCYQLHGPVGGSGDGPVAAVQQRPVPGVGEVVHEVGRRDHCVRDRKRGQVLLDPAACCRASARCGPGARPIRMPN